jgi:syntaxin-binding protein 1
LGTQKRRLLTAHTVILNSIKQTTRGDWKILIVDEDSQKLINNVVKEDDILNLNITSMRR